MLLTVRVDPKIMQRVEQALRNNDNPELANYVSQVLSLSELLAKMRELEKNNFHTEALLVWARHHKDKLVIERLERIRAKEARLGYMDHDAMAQRAALEVLLPRIPR